MTVFDSLTSFDSGLGFDGYFPTPLPSPQVPVAAPNVVTYLFTDLYGNLQAILPLTGVKFSLVLNGTGQMQGTLGVEDPNIATTGWQSATAPNKTMVWVDINGALLWGGIIQGRTWSKSQQSVTLRAADPLAYLSQRAQRVDYATTWQNTATGAMEIAHTVLTDCLSAANSLPISVTTDGTTPASEAIYFTAPLSQRWTIDMLVSRLAQLGYGVGFDFACDYAYVGGIPTATISLAYPRRGRLAGTTGLVVDESGASDFTYDEDGTEQGMVVYVLLNSRGSSGTESGTWAPAMTVDGYPLFEKISYQGMITKVADPATIYNGLIANDLVLYSYPTATATATLPLFNDPAIGSWIVGDDMELRVPKTSLVANPRFPSGLDFYMRLAKAEVTIADDGDSTVAYTLVMPPTSTPQRPPS